MVSDQIYRVIENQSNKAGEKSQTQLPKHNVFMSACEEHHVV